ncbi:MAG TPA: ABC transporter ATP-binding protein [Rhizomicrobium sp.]
MIVKGATFDHGANRIIDGLDLTLERGQITAFLGPSGCGKTTLLRLISGMEVLRRGTITIDVGRNQTPLAYMFQDYDTFPWLTVRQNLRLSGEKNPEVIAARARELGLSLLLDRYPRQLSGGQRKRVALARSILSHPALLIMDEPFGSLDVKTKIAIFEVLEISFLDGARSGLFVTHSVNEAAILADRVLVLDGPPLTIVADVAIGAPRPRKPDYLDSDIYKTAVASLMQLLMAR